MVNLFYFINFDGLYILLCLNLVEFCCCRVFPFITVYADDWSIIGVGRLYLQLHRPGINNLFE